jgi:myo-inositol catabolism protein IolS
VKYRKLGTTQIEVSTVAMGCWAVIGGLTWGDQDEAAAIEAMNVAIDHGITFFDTAPGYGDGESERLLGRALADRRDEVVIATKVSPSQLKPDDLAASVDKSLADLATDRIDVLQIHWPNWDVPLADSLDALQRLVAAGKIRAIGVSNFGPRDLADAAAIAPIAVNQLAYSLLTRAIEYDIQPLCEQHQVSILPYSPLAQGLLTGKFASADDVPPGRARTRHFSSDREHTRHGQPGCERETFDAIDSIRRVADRLGLPMGQLALAWCLHQPMVASVLAGARSPQQVTDNAKAADIQLDPATLDELERITQPVKDALGPHPDLWKAPGESRMR